jgi:hypothetical protein
MRTSVSAARSLLPVVVTGLVLLGGAGGCGSEFGKVTEGEIANIADIAFPQTQIGRPVQVQFNIRNNGDGDLIIRNVEIVDASPYIRFGTSTLTGMFTRHAWRNAPGGQSWLERPPFALGPNRELQFDLEFQPTTLDPQCPGGNPTLTCGRLVIESNDRDEGLVSVNLTLNQSAGTIVVDNTVIDFPDVVGGPWTEMFVIENRGSGPLTGISVIDPGVEGLTLAEADNRPEPFTLNQGETSTYRVTFTPVTGVGYCPQGLPCTLGVITVNSNDASGAVVSITVNVGGGSQPNIEVSRSRIEFTQAAVGNPETQTLDVSNTGGGNLTWNIRIDPIGVRPHFALEVGGTAVPASGANITQPITPGSSRTVEITLDPATNDPIAGQFVITSNDPDERTVRVDLFGGDPAPDLDVFPSSLLFHEVTRGESAELQLVLVNTGRAPLTIETSSIIGLSASEFSNAPNLTGATIAAGGRLPVTVTYSRPENDVSGLDTATLQILSDALDPNGTKNVPLYASHGATALPPTAEIAVSPDQAQFTVGETITLDAGGSEPPPGGTFGGNPYSWVLAARPDGSEARLSSSFEQEVTLTPDAAGIYTVLLTVTAIIDATTNTQGQRSINLLVTE